MPSLLKKKRKSSPSDFPEFMVSVIIPAYNAEKYLLSAAQSVISQSVDDWELLLVDDGSTDSTPDICDSLAASDSRIRAFHKPNGGLSDARNYGIDRARGEYIMFLDADDVLNPGILRRSLDVMREYSAVDIVAMPFIYFDSETCPFPPEDPTESLHILSPHEAIIAALYQRNFPGTRWRLDHSACGKLYRRSIWDENGKIRFRKGVWYEDLDIFYTLWEKARKIAFISRPMMGYRKNPQSFLHKFSAGRTHVLDVTDRMLEYYTSSPSSDTSGDIAAAARVRRYAAHWNILILLHESHTHIPEIEERCLSVIRADRTVVFRNRKARWKDRLGAMFAFAMGN